MPINTSIDSYIFKFHSKQKIMRETSTLIGKLAALLVFLSFTTASFGKAVTVTSGGLKFKSDKNQTYLMVVSAPYTGDIVVPASVYVQSIGKELPVTRVGSSAFAELDELTSVTLPESVTYIDNYAFDSSENLKSVTMSDNVTYIGHWAFRNCYNLENLKLSANIKFIGNYVFDKNYKMTEITLPATLTNIGGFVFEGNPQLKTVYSLSTTPPEVKKGYLNGDEIYTLFDDNDDYADRVLYVPEGTVDDYKLTFGWNQFKDIREIKGSTDGINAPAASTAIEVAPAGKGAMRVSAPAATTVRAYDLSGRKLFEKKVEAGTTVINGIASGIIIVNGKKVAVE